MDIKCTKDNGYSFRLSDLGIRAKDFNVSSIEMEHEYEEFDGRNGRLSIDSIYKSRVITVPFYFQSPDLNHFPFIRDEIFRHFTDVKPYAIQEIRNTNKKSYAFIEVDELPKMNQTEERISNKKYDVRLQEVIEIDQTDLFGEGELVFETSRLPFGISVGTTLKPSDQKMMNQVYEQNFGDPVIEYIFNDDYLQVWNNSDVKIDPRESYFKIIFEGESDGLVIKNLTTNEEWSYSGKTNSSDVLTIEGVRPLKNDSNIFSDTNKKIITLAQGWNEFEIENASNFDIKFDFKFLYK